MAQNPPRGLDRRRALIPAIIVLLFLVWSFWDFFTADPVDTGTGGTTTASPASSFAEELVAWFFFLAIPLLCLVPVFVRMRQQRQRARLAAQQREVMQRQAREAASAIARGVENAFKGFSRSSVARRAGAPAREPVSGRPRGSDEHRNGGRDRGRDPALIRHEEDLVHESRPLTRVNLAKYLGAHGDARTLEFLEEIIEYEPDEAVRQAIWQAIQELYDKV